MTYVTCNDGAKRCRRQVGRGVSLGNNTALKNRYYFELFRDFTNICFGKDVCVVTVGEVTSYDDEGIIQEFDE